MTGSSTTQADAVIVIAKSDIIILSVTSLALLFGVARWQMGTRYVETITIPASARVAQPVPLRGTENPDRGSAAQVSAAPGSAALPAARPISQTGSASAIGSDPAAAINGVDATASVAAAAAPDPVFGIHRVRSGQSLSKLAVQYGTTVQTLQQLNGISGTTIFIGQELRYPLPSP